MVPARYPDGDRQPPATTTSDLEAAAHHLLLPLTQK